MNLGIKNRLLASCVLTDNGCIEWSRTLSSDGYGKTKVNGKTKRAHRAMWESVHGEIPNGMFVCHSCDNPKCVNIEHLFLGTPKENMHDKMKKGRYRGGPSTWHRSNHGEGHPMAKLTVDAVMEIRRMLRDGISVKRLVEAFGVGRSTIYRIANGYGWTKVKEVAA